jgi:DNA-binding CsgD family transcriptional regulator
MRQIVLCFVFIYKSKYFHLGEDYTVIGDCVSYQQLKVLIDEISEINQSASEQEVAFRIAHICDSVLPCQWGGIGLFNKSDKATPVTIPFISHINQCATSEMDLPKWADFTSELINNWFTLRRFLFVDDLQEGDADKNGLIQTDNIVFDAIGAGEHDHGCFYYLVNIDKTMVPKYQLVMKLLLLSIHETLIRLSKHSERQAVDVLHLTQREKEIIFRIRNGLNNKSIARQLNISVNTVKSHIYNIFQKLQATNRVDALVKAEKAGYIN